MNLTFRVVPLLFLALAMSGVLSLPAHALTQREEIELGERVARDVIKKQGPVLPANAPAARRVARIGARFARLSARRGIPFSYRVLDDDQVLNAFAAPGGPVFITRRLLEWTRNDAELAAILGHETAHIEHRHIGQRVEKQEAAQKKARKIGEKYFGARATRAHQRFLRGATNIAFSVWSVGYGRENELQADQTGTRWMSRLGYDPRAAVRNLVHLRGGKQTGTAERYFSTHPPTEEREGRLQTQIKRENLLQIAQENGGPNLSDVPAPTAATPPEPAVETAPEPATRPGALPPPVPTATARAQTTPLENAAPTDVPIAVSPPASPKPTKPVPQNTAIPKANSSTVADQQPTMAPTPVGRPQQAAPTPAQTAVQPVAAPANNAPPDATIVSDDDANAAKSSSLPWGWICLGLGMVAVAAVGVAWQQGLGRPHPAIAPLVPASPIAETLSVIIQTPAGDSWRVPVLMGESLIVGRDEDADVQLNDEQVSSQHAEIRRTPHGVWLLDLDSTNGTFLSERRIGSTLWQPDERARLGATILILERAVS